MSISAERLPRWAEALLRCPRTGAAAHLDGDRLLSASGDEIGRIEQGILRIPVARPDEGIAFYRKLGGAHFHERSAVPFAMSALDTPLYHAYLDEVRPASPDGLIVDVGGGDGRNARPWLERGYTRVAVIDAAGDALVRFRRRVAEEQPAWLDRLLLIEADARHLPLAEHCADAVLAIEALGCLNEDYEIGLKESARLLSPRGKLLLSERGYEGGLIMRLLYYGLDGLLQSAHAHSLWDGPPGALLRTRCFTESELLDQLRPLGLKAVAVHGTPLLSLLLGWMNGQGQLGETQKTRLPKVHALLAELGRDGVMRRSHVVIAERG